MDYEGGREREGLGVDRRVEEGRVKKGGFLEGGRRKEGRE